MGSYEVPPSREISMFVFIDNILLMPLRELFTLRYKGLLSASPRLYQ